MKMKKVLAVALSMACASTLFVATAVTASAADKKEVVIWDYFETDAQKEMMQSLIDGFNASQDEYEASHVYVPFADYEKQLTLGIASGELPDLVILDGCSMASFIQLGLFGDISDVDINWDEYMEGPMESTMLDGKHYGIPFATNCTALFYNKDMFEAAGITKAPETWDELKDTAQKLTSGNVGGFAFCSLQNEEGTFNFMPWVWSTGATSYEMNSEGGIKALTFIKDLVDSGAMSKECINWTQGDVMNQFISGNVAMMINGPWQIPTIRQEAPDLNWDVALIPKDKEFASDLGGENWAVIAGGNEAGALDFLNYATQPEQVSFMMNTMGYISADKEIAKTQFTADGDAVYRKFIEEMEYTKARGPLAEWPSVSDAISLAFNQVMTGAMEPDKAAADAQAAIDTIVK